MPGWVNLDISALPGVDIVHDVNQLPLPFSDEQFDEILCQDVLEHVDYMPVLRDLYRILKKGGVLRIRVPHFTSRFNFVDPTHKRMFSINTFNFFVKNSYHHDSRPYYFDFVFEKLSEAKIIFEHDSPVFFLSPVLEWLVNLGPRAQMIYEATGWSRLFPACNVSVTLVK